MPQATLETVLPAAPVSLDEKCMVREFPGGFDCQCLLQFTRHKLSALHSTYNQSTVQNVTSDLQAAAEVCCSYSRA